MPKIDLSGVGVALITPFKEDFTIDYEALQHLVEFHVRSCTNYIVVLGTTAETPTLSVEEQNDVLAFVVKTAAGRIPIVVGMGGNCTHAIVNRLQTTSLDGVSAILSVTPYYNKPSQEGLFQHYSALAKASPLPLILYNVPGRTGVNLQTSTTLRLANTFENIVGVKEASGNLEQVKEIMSQAPEEFQLVSGDDALTTQIIRLGGVGVISVAANIIPDYMAHLIALATKTSADQQNALYQELFRLMFVDGNPAGVKCVLAEKGWIKPYLRLPLVPVCEDVCAQIRQSIKSCMI